MNRLINISKDFKTYTTKKDKWQAHENIFNIIRYKENAN